MKNKDEPVACVSPSRRDFLKWTVGTSACLGGVSLLPITSLKAKAAGVSEDRPQNILLVITDQQHFDTIADKIKRTMILREGAGRGKILVHMGTCGIAAGARKVMSALMEEVESRDVKDVMLSISSCAGLCSREPMLTVELQGEPAVKYVDMDPEKAKRVLVEHVLGGKIVTEYALAAGSERTL